MLAGEQTTVPTTPGGGDLSAPFTDTHGGPTFPLTTAVVVPAATSPAKSKTAHLRPGAVHWPDIGAQLKSHVETGLTKAYQSILELQAEGLVQATIAKSIEPVAIAHIETHHKNVTARLQAVVADTLTQSNATIDSAIKLLQTEYDAQRSVVHNEINAHKHTIDQALKRTRLAMAKEAQRVTSLESCLRRHEIHVLEAQHQERIQALKDEMAAKEAAHADVLLRQKSAFVDIERFSKKLQSALDDALFEIDRMKKLDQQRHTNITAVTTISESYVNSLRHAVTIANEHTEQMRLDLEQQTKEKEALERVKLGLDEAVVRLTHDAKVARELLAESARELTELNAQTDLVLACDDCVADLRNQVDSHANHVLKITAEHAQMRERWDAESSRLHQVHAADRATIEALVGKLALLGYDKNTLEIYVPRSSSSTASSQPSPSRTATSGAAPASTTVPTPITGQPRRPSMASDAAVGTRCHATLRHHNQYDSLVNVLQREAIGLPEEHAQRLFDMEASVRESVTAQLTYEFKRTFSKQLRQRMQQERFFVLEKFDSIIAKSLVEERAAKQLLAKQAKAVGRKASLRCVPETTMTLRKVKSTIAQAYDAMGVIEWNGEDVAEMKRQVAAVTKENADLAATVVELEGKVEIQLLSLAEAELFQKERDMLLVELTKKFHDAKDELAHVKRHHNPPPCEHDHGSNQVGDAACNVRLVVQGQLPHMEQHPRRAVRSTDLASHAVRPQSAAAASTPAKGTSSVSAVAKKPRPATSRGATASTKKQSILPSTHQGGPHHDHHAKTQPEHVRSAMKWELLGERNDKESSPQEDIVVASAWVGEAGVRPILVPFNLRLPA
ncbi:hypothetical protein DYB32_001404 [Aphanomyces invadans]|uniref:Uncharacterized protein n=1 Tax=Aphanomyces invadans TaxID=157072 RepID=A0A3R7D5R5_9STRA|nr:hypothetical protein DYB32_001404 [Aphanomyces invadans]